MRKLFVVIFAILMAAVCSQALMTGLQHFVVPRGHRLSAYSPTEPFAALAMFAFFLCVCAGLAAAAGCYLRRYSALMRWSVVLLPMLVAGLLMTALKAAQFQSAVTVAESLGMPPAFSLRQAYLYMIPAAALAAGLLALGAAICLCARNGQPGALNGGPAATQLGDSGVAEGPPSVS
jgi:SNF family Na+-dependent transporter